MADGNDSDGRKNQDDRRRKSNEGAERAHRDNDHRQQRESDFQGWNAQPRYRDATGPSPPAAWPWNQQRGNDQGRKAYYGKGAKTRQRNAKRKREGSGAPKSDDQIDKMVANIVEKTKRIPHRVNLPGCPLIPGGWPTPDPHYLRRIREAEACFLCQWVDSEGLPLCDGRHRNAAYQPIVLLTGIGHAGSDGKAATAKREENQGHRRELKKALSFRASPSDSSQDTVVDPMKALKAAKANLEKQAATQEEEARLQREKTARQILSADEAIQSQQQEQTKKDAEDAAAKEKAEQAQLAVQNVRERGNDGNAINSNGAAKPEGIAGQPIEQASDRELLLAIHESVIDTQTYVLSIIANAVGKLNRTVETHLENATKQQRAFQGENLKDRKEFRRDLKKQIGNQMTNRSNDEAEDRKKSSKELCDRFDRANEAAQQEMFQLLRKAGEEEANPSGVEPSSPRSPVVDADGESADQGMAAPAPSPDEDRVGEQAEMIQAQPVLEQFMYNTPSPMTPSLFLNLD